MRPHKRIRRPGIRSQLLAGYAVFALVTVLLLWIFQISLLNPFYKFIKQREVKTTAEYVIQNIDSPDIVDILSDIVKKRGIDVMITNEYGENVVSVYSSHSLFFDRLGRKECAVLYSQVAAKGGETLDYYDVPGAVALPSEVEGPLGSMVYIRLTGSSDGSSRMVMLATAVTPVDATVDTLKVQLWCLTFVMLLMSLVLALVISRGISKPIEEINAGAAEFARGNYGIRFRARGSRETAALADTLNYAGEELSKVEGLRRELIANVSHDLRTPLTMIKGYSEVMRDIPGENTPENIQIIIDETERLTSLVNDLLDISKLESGNMKVEPVRMNLTRAVDSIMRRYDKLADYSFSFYHGEDIYVYADELKISQVIYNLVNNAINYTGEDKSVTVTQTVENGRVKIEVTDTGEGIPQDKLRDIWDRYYKIDKEHRRAAVGTGLGLSIVKKILELHGGEYGVVSAEGRGSTFWFSLMMAADQSPKLPPEASKNIDFETMME